MAHDSEPDAASVAQGEARRLSAHPDSPVSALAFRRELRAKVGIEIPIVADPRGAGVFVQVPALIELHNRTPSYVPYQYWRGRVSVEGGYRWSVRAGGAGSALALSAALEHESDHTSVGGGGFMNLNGASVRSDWTIAVRHSFLTVALYPRLHFLTCTISAATCGDEGGRAGSRAFEQVGEIVFDAGLSSPAWGRPRLFASIAGSWLARHSLAADERRLTADLGIYVRTRHRGLFQAHVLSLVGYDVGYFRNVSSPTQLGFGIRWAP